MSKRRVVVTGIGMISPVGNSVPDSFGFGGTNASLIFCDVE